MKRTFLAIGLALMLGTAVEAKTPKEVAVPYKAYVAALKADQKKQAAEYAYKAWQAAEAVMGDHKTTGDLASNYADIDVDGGRSKDQMAAAKRALELASTYGDDAKFIFMERGILLMQYHQANGDRSKIRKQADVLIDYAKKSGQDKSILYAEVLTLKAATFVESRDGKAIVEMTDEALAVFADPSDDYASPYPILATLINGFGHEYEEDILDAALSYQKVMDSVGHLDYGKHPIVGRALGRWSHMRSRLQKAGELKEAKEKGVCDCWPYDIERNESVKPVKRYPPKFPESALSQSVSGYTIVQFDLSDSGDVVNPEIIISWPPEVYEKSSLRALKRWEYSPRQAGETDKDRENLITTIRYDIQDRFGRPVY